MDQTDLQLGAYRLYKRIGGGGFATVYAARDVRTNALVAIKILHPHLAQDAQFVARFRREAENLRKLPPHPNIVRFLSVGQQGNINFLVFEYLEGKDLSQVIAERRQLPVGEAIGIASQIAQALEVAHRHGLVHRDIKPSNIKITPQGMVKVLDFGIARAAEGTKLTQTGTFMGTPDYMAPEIWEGKTTDIRSDIYALGALFFEMLTGVSPFRAETPAVVMRRHLMEAVPSIRMKRTDVPLFVEQIIARMMAKRPEARYQGPSEVLTALQIGNPGLATPAVLRDAPTILANRSQSSTRNLAFPVIAAVMGGVVLVCLFLGAVALRGTSIAAAPVMPQTATLSVGTNSTAQAQTTALAGMQATADAQAVALAGVQATSTVLARANSIAQANVTATEQARQTQSTGATAAAAATAIVVRRVTEQAAALATAAEQTRRRPTPAPVLGTPPADADLILKYRRLYCPISDPSLGSIRLENNVRQQDYDRGYEIAVLMSKDGNAIISTVIPDGAMLCISDLTPGIYSYNVGRPEFGSITESVEMKSSSDERRVFCLEGSLKTRIYKIKSGGC